MSNPSPLEQLAGDNDVEFDIDKYQSGFYDIDKLQQQQAARNGQDFDVNSWESGKGGKPGPSLLEQLAATPAAPEMSAEDKASQTRQMAVGALTGMPTPNMTPQDVQQFQAGKAAGAVSVPLVAAGATAAALTAPTIVSGTEGAGFLMKEVAKEGPSIAAKALDALSEAAAAHPFVRHVIKIGLTGLIGGAAIAKGSKLARLLE